MVEKKKRLFRPEGPLGSFSARIDLAYALGLIGKKAARDLHLIRKIRNDFAHDPKTIMFDDDRVAKRCSELYYDGLGGNLPPHKKFLRVAMGVAAVIHVAQSLPKLRLRLHLDDGRLIRCLLHSAILVASLRMLAISSSYHP